MEYSTQQNHIFVVEDEETTRVLMTRILEKQNYKVTSFVTGQEFLDFFKKSSLKPDLILLDIVLPDLSGTQCLYELKSNPDLANISVIMTTSEKKEDLIKEVFLAGANDYLIKPVNTNMVLERVKSNLTINLSLSEIRELLSRLHLEDPNLMKQYGLKEFSKKEPRCYPISYKERKACFLIPQEYKPRSLKDASEEMLYSQLKIFVHNSVRWNQIWPNQLYLDMNTSPPFSKIINQDDIENKIYVDKISYSLPLDKSLIKEFSQLKEISIGMPCEISSNICKKILKWSEDRVSCESEIELLKEKFNILYEAQRNQK